MEDERMRDAAWYLQHLERRLFNPDAEGMLVERLGADEVRWAVNAVRRKIPLVGAAFESVDRWTDQELVLPTGPCLPSLPSEDSPEELSAEDLKRCVRMTQVVQLRNSFGVGVFVGVIYAVITESGSDDPLDSEITLSRVLELFASSGLTPDDLLDSGEKPWTVCLQRHIHQLRGRIPIMRTLRPIVERHGFLKTPEVVFSGWRLRYAKRSMFLAGLMASGLKPGPLLKGRSNPSSARKGGVQSPHRGTEAPLDLFHRTDEELEPLLGDESMRDQVAEELEFRLRNNRLSRMLAHLRRISRGEGEVNVDDD